MKIKTIIIFILITAGIVTILFLSTYPLNPTPAPNNNTSSSTNTPQDISQTSPTTTQEKKQTNDKKSITTPENIKTPQKIPNPPTTPTPTPEISKSNSGTTFVESFQTTYSVVEADKLADSTSPGWWLGSGAYFYSAQGIGSTLVGSLKANNPFRIAYSTSNPVDTNNGYYPQNVFRLVLTRGKWLNFQQEAHFKVVNNNLSQSPNRNESNGLLFFNRYQDTDNLYYTGIRVDGAAVIKKKIHGTYYELSLNQFYKNSSYNPVTNPTLIPKNKWIGLRSEIKTNPDNTVSIKLFIDKDNTGDWVLATEAKDDGKSYGGKAILNEGYTGIRTDFMDVEFDNYKVTQE